MTVDRRREFHASDSRRSVDALLTCVDRASLRCGTGCDAVGCWGEVIDHSECQVEPRPTDELIGLLYMEDGAGTLVAATPERRPAVTSVSVPLGAPADAATVSGVTVTTREILAWVNAGDFGRALALYSDKLILEFRPDPGETSEETRASLEVAPEPVPVEQRVRLIAITDVSVMGALARWS